MRKQALKLPFVSIIMPVRNEAATIARSVNAVLLQTYPAECYEIIVADGMSDDNTVEIIKQLPHAERITIVINERLIQSAGMNRALAIASGDVIVRVDGHTVIGGDYVRRCVNALITPGTVSVGGSIYPVASTAMGRAIALASRSRFAIPSTFRTSSKSQNTDTAYMGAWWRATFDRIGKFDEDFMVNEDYELNYRIRAAGGSVLYLPDLYSEYYGRQNLRGLAQQYFRYGCGKPKTIHKHPASLRFRHLVAPLWVAFIFLGSLVALISAEATFLWMTAVILYLYLLSNIAISFRLGYKNSLGVLFRLPSVFLTIHVAWGIGFWCGVGQILGKHFTPKRLSLP